MDKIKLFCFPYAGGSAAIYSKWKRYLHDSIELCPMELAGRGKRFKDPFYRSLEEVIDDLYHKIEKDPSSAGYALFGHSMGGLIVFELSRKIREMNFQPPMHLFVSGRSAPHVHEDDQCLHLLPDAEFKAEILKIGGTPDELFEHEELLSIFLPILRHDYLVLETYNYVAKKNLDVDLSVLFGKEDRELKGDINEWRTHTTKNCRFYPFEGDHFFIHNQTDQIVAIINNTLVKNN